jgi:hypothetical protein
MGMFHHEGRKPDEYVRRPLDDAPPFKAFSPIRVLAATAEHPDLPKILGKNSFSR